MYAVKRGEKPETLAATRSKKAVPALTIHPIPPITTPWGRANLLRDACFISTSYTIPLASPRSWLRARLDSSVFKRNGGSTSEQKYRDAVWVTSVSNFKDQNGTGTVRLRTRKLELTSRAQFLSVWASFPRYLSHNDTMVPRTHGKKKKKPSSSKSHLVNQPHRVLWFTRSIKIHRPHASPIMKRTTNPLSKKKMIQ
jgi:hypothetical protein